MSANNDREKMLRELTAALRDNFESKWEYYNERGLSPKEIARDYVTKFKRGMCASLAQLRANLYFSEFQSNQTKLGTFIQTLVEQAREIDRDSLEMCAQFIILLSDNKTPLPMPLAELASDLMIGRLKIPRPGRPTTIKRDIMIVEAIYLMIQCYPKLKATRNPEGDNESASSILSEVLPEFGINLSRKSVETIFSSDRTYLSIFD